MESEEVNLVAVLADWTGLVGFVIALSAIVATYLTRPRFRRYVRPRTPGFKHQTGQLVLTQTGAASARNVRASWRVILPNGGADGDRFLVAAEFDSDRSFTATFFIEGTPSLLTPPDPERELRIEVPSHAYGFNFALTYSSPLLPWRLKRLKWIGWIAPGETGAPEVFTREPAFWERFPPPDNAPLNQPRWRRQSR